MTGRARQLLDEALTLVPEERSVGAAESLPSLGESPAADHPETGEAWAAAEIERRARRVLSGQSSDESWEADRARVARRQSER